MAEATTSGNQWGMIASAALSALGSGMSASSASKASAQAAAQRSASDLNAIGYERALEDWYARKNKQEKRMALENYNQFSTIKQFAPNYADAYHPAPVGAVPTTGDYLATKANPAGNIANQQRNGLQGIGSVVLPQGGG